MDKGGFCWYWKRLSGLPVSGTCFYNCHQKQNVTRSWLQVHHFWFQLTCPPQFETLLERRSSEFTMSSLVCTCSSPYNFLFSSPFAPYFLSFLLSHILLCLHFKRGCIHQQTEVRNSYSVHGSRTHDLNLCHLTTRHCSQTCKERWVTVCITSEVDYLTEPFNHCAYCKYHLPGQLRNFDFWLLCDPVVAFCSVWWKHLRIFSSL